MGNINEQKKAEKVDEFYLEVDNFFEGLTDDQKRIMFLEAYNYALDNYSYYNIDSLKKVVKRFKEADDDGKNKIVDIVLKTIIFNSGSLINSINRLKCDAKGKHCFGPWEEHKTIKAEYFDRSEFHTLESALYGTYGKTEKEEVFWRRYCRVCGDVEITDTKPESLIKKEKRRNF